MATDERQAKKLLSDEALAAQIADGDAAAFQVLAVRLGPKLAAFAGKVLGDQSQGEDMVQDSLIKFWKAPDRYDPTRAQFSTWIHKVVLNRCLDEKRRKKPVALPEGFDAPDDRPDQDQNLSQASTDLAVRQAIDTLAPRQRAALLLFHMDDLSQKEAAAVMDLSAKAFESLLIRARKTLKDCLAPMKEDLL